jgi:hypothetical protein
MFKSRGVLECLGEQGKQTALRTVLEGTNEATPHSSCWSQTQKSHPAVDQSPCRREEVHPTWTQSSHSQAGTHHKRPGGTSVTYCTREQSFTLWINGDIWWQPIGLPLHQVSILSAKCRSMLCNVIPYFRQGEAFLSDP